jgi:hypothetical protein
MALTDVAIRGLVHGDKPIKKSDERGLFLLLQPSGGKLWRFKYRFNGKERKLGFGRYPDVSLKKARRRRDQAREILAMGQDPGEAKKQAALMAALNAANSFEAVGNEYLDKAAREGREAVTINKSSEPSFEVLRVELIRSDPSTDIKAAMLLFEDRVRFEIASSLAKRMGVELGEDPRPHLVTETVMGLARWIRRYKARGNMPDQSLKSLNFRQLLEEQLRYMGSLSQTADK